MTQANAKPLTEPPLLDTFRHRQSMANAMRFTTLELAETEGRIASAAERALAIEQDIFAELTARRGGGQSPCCRMSPRPWPSLIMSRPWPELARNESYVRPAIDESRCFDIRGGRHPVVEQALKRARSGPFVENDCILGGAGTERPSG